MENNDGRLCVWAWVTLNWVDRVLVAYLWAENWVTEGRSGSQAFRQST